MAPSLLKGEAQAEPTNGKADWLFEGGTILTMESDRPQAEAVAVRGREIVYVGDRRGVQAWLGPATQRVDLKGGMLLHGLIDSHVHPLLGALLRSGIALKIESREGEVLASIADYVKANPGTGVFFGQGWDSNLFRDQGGPHRRDLDAISADKPMFFFSSDGHSGWANSKALALAGSMRSGVSRRVAGLHADRSFIAERSTRCAFCSRIQDAGSSDGINPPP